MIAARSGNDTAVNSLELLVGKLDTLFLSKSEELVYALRGLCLLDLLWRENIDCHDVPFLGVLTYLYVPSR